MRHERLTSFETPASRAAFQLRQVTQHLSVRPLGMYDRGYGNAKFVNQTSDIEADLLRLHWTQPQLSSFRATERWSELMPLLTWPLWLAFWRRIGTPAPPPKPCGKSPGRAKGVKPAPRPRYPMVKKRVSKRPNSVPASTDSQSSIA